MAEVNIAWHYYSWTLDRDFPSPRDSALSNEDDNLNAEASRLEPQ